MNWEAIGAIGEIVGAIAVLISLIFIGLQVRQSAAQTAKSNLLARADMTERAMRAFGDTAIELSRSQELSSAFRKAMFKSSKLTDDEQTIVFTYFNVWLQRHRSAFMSVPENLIDARVMDDYDNTTRWYLTAQAFRDEFRRNQNNGIFSGEFSDHIQSLMPHE